MRASERVARAQRALAAGAAASALLWAIAVAALACTLGVGGVAAGLGALAAAAVVVGRALPVRRPERVALWLEEQVPALEYALVTSLDPAGAAYAGELESRLAGIAFEPVARRAAWRSLALPSGAAALAVLLLAVVPSRALRPGGVPGVVDGRVPNGQSAVDALAGLSARIEPPRYTGLEAEVLDDPVRIPALVGSMITIEGRAGGEPVRGVADKDPLLIAIGAGRWRTRFPMPNAPTVVRLAQSSRERLLLLEPRADSVPVVTLDSPVRDTVLRIAAGVLPLAAAFRDDFGLAEGWWELVVSRGEGESFAFRTLVLGRAGFGNSRSGSRAWRLSLDSLNLEPGDLVHIRAVARDGNTVTGPGLAGSDVRTIRVARAGEYDSVAVEALPPPDPIAGLISERMLILLTEALERKRPRLPRPELVAESGRIARDQNTLRREVGDIVFSRLGGDGRESVRDENARDALTPDALLEAAEAASVRAGGERVDFAEDETPVVAINRPLLEAYNAMWDAGRALGIADPRRALPHMYAALAAIQRARLAERVYLRGATKPVIVDLAKIRLVGKKDGIEPRSRAPRVGEDDVMARRAARFDAAIGLLRAGPAAAIDSLLLLRAELLVAAPAAATPLGDALDALRSGRDATGALVRARRALLGPATAGAGLSPWGGLP
ncbi:MAG: hypothetical protein ABI647_11460 [Gemmatimonadota bacterium]